MDRMNDEIKEVASLNNFLESASSRGCPQQTETATNSHVDDVMLPKDPVPISTNGRKRTARIKSSTEKKCVLHRGRMVRLELGDIRNIPLKRTAVELERPVAKKPRSSKEEG